MSNIPFAPARVPEAPRLLDRVREWLRRKRYGLRTEAAYVGWIKRHIHFHGKRQPVRMGKAEVEAFLTSLAVARKVHAATQNPALARCRSFVAGCREDREAGTACRAARLRRAGARRRRVSRCGGA